VLISSIIMRLAVCLFFLFATCCLTASVAPLTIKEVELMLRSGYSSDSVLAELAKRKCADTLDAATEKQLIQAGASQPLVEALRTGAYQLSAAETAREQQKQATPRAPVPQPTRIAQTPDRKLPAHPIEAQIGGTMYDHFKDDLVYWHEGSLVPFDDGTLQNKKFYLLFFSGFWSKEGRLFTSRLVDYYNRVVPQHPELEVIFFSVDRSAFVMEDYVRRTNMPWPALAFDKRDGKAGAIQDSLVHTIPHLILADASGRILSDSGDTQPNLERVLTDLDRILQTASTTASASR
jgi:hypothetical protein